MWQHWLNFVLGLWLILSAFIAFTASGMTTNLIIVGIAVAVLALWGALEGRVQHAVERRHRHA